MPQPRNDAEIIPDPEVSSPLAFAVAERDRATLSMVRNALVRKDVLLAFQPIVQARRMTRVAFHEGLIRVLDEEGKVIPEGDFIHACETTEMGRMLDCLSLELGLKALGAEPGLRLSINMSARLIGYPRWTETLENGLRDDPGIAERLILEITESSAMVIPDLVLHFMTKLQRRGISFALDDFGAGFTSFRYLKDFTFDAIKIDGAFIRGIARNADNQCLTQALAAVAQHFDMFTVAECVENAEDAAYLAELGIDCLQGYHFGAPTTRPVWHDEREVRMTG